MLKNKAAFLLRLHETLSLVKTVRDSPVSWSVDGSSFFITDPTSFLQNIFSIYYESMSVASFEQKLRSWGFVKRPTDISVRVSAENVTYSHPCFTRDKKPLIQRIQSDMNVSISSHSVITVMYGCLFSLVTFSFSQNIRLNPYPWSSRFLFDCASC